MMNKETDKKPDDSGLIECPYCGKLTSAELDNCEHCKEWLTENDTIEYSKLGFTVSIFSLLFCWNQIVHILLWPTGLYTSLMGVSRKEKGLAIAGIIISILSILIKTPMFSGLRQYISKILEGAITYF